MRTLSTYLLTLTVICFAGSLITGWAAWDAKIAEPQAQKEYDDKWLSELDGKVNQITDIEQLRAITLQLGYLAKRTNLGYEELAEQHQHSLSALPEILAAFTFLIGFAWWQSRKGDASA